jgi:hypothetical protein
MAGEIKFAGRIQKGNIKGKSPSTSWILTARSLAFM